MSSYIYILAPLGLGVILTFCTAGYCCYRRYKKRVYVRDIREKYIMQKIGALEGPGWSEVRPPGKFDFLRKKKKKGEFVGFYGDDLPPQQMNPNPYANPYNQDFPPEGSVLSSGFSRPPVHPEETLYLNQLNQNAYDEDPRDLVANGLHQNAYHTNDGYPQYQGSELSFGGGSIASDRRLINSPPLYLNDTDQQGQTETRQFGRRGRFPNAGMSQQNDYNYQNPARG